MNNKPHILVISQYFYPEQFRINDLCKEWVKRGYKVSVVTGIPNYPKGKFYKGYGIFSKTSEIYEGIAIRRLPLIPRGNNPIMLCLNYISFVISGYFWAMMSRVKADYVFVFEVSPMTQALPGIWYAHKNKIPCYLYVQDLWPDNVEHMTGIHNKCFISLLNKMVQFIYDRCEMIFATSNSLVKTIAQRGVNCNKLKYWPQYAEDFYMPIKGKRHDIKDSNKVSDFNIIFTGNIGKAQGLDILPKAAEYLKNEHVIFNIVGDGRYLPEFIQEINKRHVNNQFRFWGKRAPEEIPSILCSNDAAFLSFMNTPLFSMTIPAKLQSYMACGMPIIASVSGESQNIIEEAHCGICCKTGDPVDLAAAIRKMMSSNELNKMSKNSIKYYQNHFNKNRLLDEIEIYFRR